MSYSRSTEILSLFYMITNGCLTIEQFQGCQGLHLGGGGQRGAGEATAVAEGDGVAHASNAQEWVHGQLGGSRVAPLQRLPLLRHRAGHRLHQRPRRVAGGPHAHPILQPLPSLQHHLRPSSNLIECRPEANGLGSTFRYPIMHRLTKSNGYAGRRHATNGLVQESQG